MAVMGKCLCGAVRLTAASAEPHFHACHCSMCRRWSGGGPMFATRAQGLELEGEENLERYDSSEWGQRGFCRKCGTNLFYFFKPTQQYIVSIGAFDEAGTFSLAGEIYIDSKPASYALAGEHERLTEAEFLAKYVPSA
jgi:hypothetical protein